MIALMKSGYVEENGRENDPWLIMYMEEYSAVIGYFKSNNVNPADYHTFEVEMRNGSFKEIEGTEKQIPPIPDEYKVTCRICSLQEYTGNRDLDSDFHHGFTIGKTGKKMYFMFVWHATGNVTVYGLGNAAPRWLPGDTEITIHYK